MQFQFRPYNNIKQSNSTTHHITEINYSKTAQVYRKHISLLCLTMPCEGCLHCLIWNDVIPVQLTNLRSKLTSKLCWRGRGNGFVEPECRCQDPPQRAIASVHTPPTPALGLQRQADPYKSAVSKFSGRRTLKTKVEHAWRRRLMDLTSRMQVYTCLHAYTCSDKHRCTQVCTHMHLHALSLTHEHMQACTQWQELWECIQLSRLNKYTLLGAMMCLMPGEAEGASYLETAHVTQSS